MCTHPALPTIQLPHQLVCTAGQPRHSPLSPFPSSVFCRPLLHSFPSAGEQRQKTLLLAAAIAALFLIGYVFTEIIPIPLVIRAQFFRSSRFLIIIALILIAHNSCINTSLWAPPMGTPAGPRPHGAAWDRPFTKLPF